MKNLNLNLFALALALILVMVGSANAHADADAKRDDHDADGSGFYDGAAKWAASVGPFSDGEGRPRLSSDLIYDCAGGGACRERTSKAIGKAKDACHAVQEEAGAVVRETAHLTKEAVDKAKQKANYDKDAIAKTAHHARQAVSAGQKVAKEQGKEMMKKVKEAKDIVRTLGGDISGNVTRAIEGGGLGSVVNLLASASAFGEGLWVTFIWGPSLKTNLPRQHLEVVEAKMYRRYFKTMSSAIAMALLGHRLSPRSADALQSFNLLASLLMLLVNLALVKPLSDKVVQERIKLEKEEGEEATTTRTARLNHRTKRLDLYSSLLNGTSLLALTWHLYYLSHRLSATA